jgi:S-adenosylmethionine:tRNA ribosyltransferase-isomerase
MKTRDFSFNLPDERIAQNPPDKRGDSRLMVLDRLTGAIDHKQFRDLPSLIDPESVLVTNDSRVRKARVFGKSESGGTVEFLFTERIDETAWKAIVSKSKKQRAGKIFVFGDMVRGRIESEDGEIRIVRFDEAIGEDFFERFGHIPLPPYIKRKDETVDAERYQTVFSDSPGSAAAPTAGLHFTTELVTELETRGINVTSVTLHVGLGTFLPIRTENIEEHKMHSEEYFISDQSARIVNDAHDSGRKIIAVGTTVVRTLESASLEGAVRPGRGRTGLFIYPGYEFKAVDRMLTNFHTPGSSLLVLVSAFAGKSLIDKAYSEAIEKGYRFFSYGDAMLIL